MYDGIKKALRQTQNRTAPLKSSTGEIITDRGQQMERWVEHYANLYSIKTTDELDAEPMLEHLSKAIDSLFSGKAPGRDRTPP